MFQARRPGLAFPEGLKGSAKVHLRPGPVQRHPVLHVNRQRGAIGLHRLVQPRRPRLAFTKREKGIAEVVLRRGPVQRHPVLPIFRQGGA